VHLRAAVPGHFLDAARTVRAEVVERYYDASPQPGAEHPPGVDFTN
jgi:hypothetical protein